MRLNFRTMFSLYIVHFEVIHLKKKKNLNFSVLKGGLKSYEKKGLSNLLNRQCYSIMVNVFNIT